MSMKKIYEHSNDLHIRKYLLYGKTADSKLYADKDFKEKVSAADVENAYQKGALMIVNGTTYLTPVSYAAGTVKTIDDSGATIATKSWTASESE